jgi:hypothetical protein
MKQDLLEFSIIKKKLLNVLFLNLNPSNRQTLLKMDHIHIKTFQTVKDDGCHYNCF